MVLIESDESDNEITVKEEPIQSRSSSSQPETTTATESKLVAGDDSDGFETASEREVSDNEEEDESELIQQSDKPVQKDDESKQVKIYINFSVIFDLNQSFDFTLMVNCVCFGRRKPWKMQMKLN